MSKELNGSVKLENVEEPGHLYDEEYYKCGYGAVPYARSEPHWFSFFGIVAEQLIRAFRPQRVLDAGCALGFLVEAFWDRGVQAWGIDVSSYAISQVRRDMQPYCSCASLADGISGFYDLITCIEVVEHMPQDQSLAAIGHLTKATDAILFSSTPYNVEEPTHFNVRPLVHWLQAFRDQGFAPDLDFDASFLCSHAILFRRSQQALSDEVLRLYSNFLHKRQEIALSNTCVNQLQSEKHALLAENQALHSEIEVLRREKEAWQVEREALAAHPVRIRILEQEAAAAAETQEKVRAELEFAIREIEQLAGTRAAGPAPAQVEGPQPDEVLESIARAVRSHTSALKAMEYRLGSMEQQNAQLSSGLTSVTDSKIWRTLVRGAGVLQKLLRL